MLEKTITEEFKKEFVRRVRDESLVRIHRCLDQLSEEQIWYRPNENSNSVGNLVLHLCGNITQYILTGIGGREDLRARATEFSARQTHNRQQLKEQIEQVVRDAVEVIETVRPDMLRQVRPVQVFQESVLAMMVHVIEHISYHTGQIAWMTKWMTDEDLGFYADLDL